MGESAKGPSCQALEDGDRDATAMRNANRKDLQKLKILLESK